MRVTVLSQVLWQARLRGPRFFEPASEFGLAGGSLMCGTHRPLRNRLPGVSPVFLRYAPCRPVILSPGNRSCANASAASGCHTQPSRFAAVDGRTRSQNRPPTPSGGRSRFWERCIRHEHHRSRAALGIEAGPLSGNHCQNDSPGRSGHHYLGPALGKEHKPRICQRGRSSTP
jgi:hypothetical protein